MPTSERESRASHIVTSTTYFPGADTNVMNSAYMLDEGSYKEQLGLIAKVPVN